MRETLWTAARGFFMGAADIVPGVSGGTIALLFGIYERLIASVKAGSSFLGAAVRLDRAGARRWFTTIEWAFIIPLLAGIGIAILLLASLLQSLLEDYPIQMAALFLGLIVGSIVVVWQLLGTRDGLRIAVLLGTAGVVFILLGLRGGTTEETVSQVADPAIWAFFLSGAIAICAMILPGISGAFILVLLGMYTVVLDAVSDLDLTRLLALGLGAIIGLALFSQVLHWSLKHHHDTVMALLIGLMAGSLRVLWPWPDGLESTALDPPDEASVPAAVLAIGAALIVIGLSALAKRRARSA